MDRDKLSTLGLTATQVENALYNAYGTRQVSQIYAPNNQYQVILQVAPEFQSDPAAMSLLYVRVEQRPADSARVGRAAEDRRRAAPGQSLRSAAVGDDLVQPGAGLRARRRGRRRFRRRRPTTLPATITLAVPGHGAGVPGFAARPRPGAADGDRRHLHRARRALRELHAPADDSLGPAVGRLRRAADAA